MKFNSRIGKNDGFTLIETMIVVGILAIISYSMTSMLVNSGKELRKLAIRHEKLEHRAYLQKALADASICTCNLQAAVAPFPETASQVNVANLKVDCAATATVIAQPNTQVPATNTTLRVKTIEIKNISMLAANRFQGTFQVSYDLPDGTDAGLPWEAIVKFRTDPTSPSSAKVFTACESVSFSGGGGGAGGTLSVACPSGQFLTGINGTTPQCSSIIIPGQPPANDPGGYSPTNPGPGCTGDYCMTVDYGPCNGWSCITNGTSCNGDYCNACNNTGSCSGWSCCTGLQCPKCSKIGL